MTNINKANRQVCDVNILDSATKKPFLNLDTANTTTTGLTSEDTFAMAKGAKKIAFSNPLDGTLTIEAQIFPFKLFSLIGDGTIKNDVVRSVKETIKATEAGSISVPTGALAGTIYVFNQGEYGEKEIQGTYVAEKFTATQASDIAIGSLYDVAYMVAKTTGVQRISFNNKALPKEYYITMSTVEKAEDGLLTPYEIIAYKAKPKRNLTLAFSSIGDPVSVSLEFSLMEDKDGNVMDMIEIDDAE